MYLCLSLKTKGCGKAWGVSHCRTGPCCLYFCAWAGWAGSCPALLQTLACLWKSAEPKGNSNQHENVKAPQWRDECLHKNRTDWHAASDAGKICRCAYVSSHKITITVFFLHWKSYSFFAYKNTVWQLCICYQWLSGSKRYKQRSLWLIYTISSLKSYVCSVWQTDWH